jgi:alkylhydroperoxidase family enzyme
VTRIPPVPEDCQTPPELLAAIRARRGGRLLNLDRTLLQSPPLAQGWNDFLRVIRSALTVSPLLREIAVCGVAVLNGADYEFAQHEPEFRRAGGSAEAASRLKDFESAADDNAIFSAVERAVMALTIRMTRHVEVDDATWERLVSELPEVQAQVEIVGVIATYNMVSRFLIACRIDAEAADGKGHG